MTFCHYFSPHFFVHSKGFNISTNEVGGRFTSVFIPTTETVFNSFFKGMSVWLVIPESLSTFQNIVESIRWFISHCTLGLSLWYTLFRESLGLLFLYSKIINSKKCFFFSILFFFNCVFLQIYIFNARKWIILIGVQIVFSPPYVSYLSDVRVRQWCTVDVEWGFLIALLDRTLGTDSLRGNLILVFFAIILIT